MSAALGSTAGAAAAAAMHQQQQACMTAWAAFADRAASEQAKAATPLPTLEEAAAICAAGLTEMLVAFVYERVEATLRQLHVETFWRRLQHRQPGEGLEEQLLTALQGLTSAVATQQHELTLLAQQLLGAAGGSDPDSGSRSDSSGAAAGTLAAVLVGLLPRYRTLVGATLQSTAPLSITALLRRYYASKLKELCNAMDSGNQGDEDADGGPSDTEAAAAGRDQGVLHGGASMRQHGGGAGPGGDAGGDAMQEARDDDEDADMEDGEGGDGGSREGSAAAGFGAGRGIGPNSGLCTQSALASLGAEWCWRLRCVSSCLVALGLEAASEEAYTAVVNNHVQRQLESRASKVFDRRVLPAAQRTACQVPLEFLRLLLMTGSRRSAAGGRAVSDGGGMSDDGDDAAAGGVEWTPGPWGWGAAEADEDEAMLQLQEWRLRLTYLLLETLGALRTSDMFDAVVDYPDSAPAVQDLAECLRHTNLAPAFARRFGAALQARLLHAGAATADIIHTYVSTIRALHTLDPSGALLEAVGDPVRAYLRRRPDTIRAIVSLLTADGGGAGRGEGEGGDAGGGGGGLLEELGAVAAGGGAAGAGAGAAWVSEGEGDEAAIRLLQGLEQGGGITGLAAASQAASPQPDVVSLLIGIYGGAGPFLDEYRSMLAVRLMSKGGYDCEREVRTLEMLKIRFGDSDLHHCEVMLRDIADSKRMDQAVRDMGPPQAAPATPLPTRRARAAAATAGATSPGVAAARTAGQRLLAAMAANAAAAAAAAGGDVGDGVGSPSSPDRVGIEGAGPSLPPGTTAALSRLRATICSHLFWPSLEERELALPPELKAAMEVYAERYHHLKAPRKLLWRPSLGAVTLEVACGPTTMEFRVTPLHAALLMRFSGTSTTDALTASQLAAVLGAPQAVVRRKALFWVNNGVLAEGRTAGGDVAYRRVEELDVSRIVSTEATDLSWDDASGAGAGGAAEEAALADMAPFENYILGILTNFSSVALDRLHNLLRVFVVGEPKYEGRTQEQLAAFLAHLVAAGKVEVDNGIYKRKKG